MKCAKCGTDIAYGSMLCHYCGREVQLVPEYTKLDELINQTIENGINEQQKASLSNTGARICYLNKNHDTSKSNRSNNSNNTGRMNNANSGRGNSTGKSGNIERSNNTGKSGNIERNSSTGKMNNSGRSKNIHIQPADDVTKKNKKEKSRLIKKRIKSILFIFLILTIIIVICYFSQRYRQYQSFDYQKTKAEECIAEYDYEAALKYVERALEINYNDPDAKILQAQIYILLGNRDSAEKILLSLIEDYPGLEGGYQQIVNFYAVRGDAANTLAEIFNNCEDENIRNIYSEYLTASVTFSLEAGTYASEKTLELSTIESCDIYYTIDGSVPTMSGLLYTEPITLTNGDNTIYAAAYNTYGLCGEVTYQKYSIEIPKPVKPSVSPSSGQFYVPTNITIIVPSGCTAYYTFDGTTPSTVSNIYTEPIAMAKGNYLFSVVIVDQYGRRSDVARYSYVLELSN